MTTVFVLEFGQYEERYVAGVFSTREKAMAAAGGEHVKWKHLGPDRNEDERWTTSGSFGSDGWYSSADVVPYVLDKLD